MKQIFIALMFVLGLAAMPALSHPHYITPSLVGTDTVCEGNFEDFAANATEDYIVISGASLDAFADIVMKAIGAAKPAEITAIAIQADMSDKDGDGNIVFSTFIADNCPFGVGAGYVPISVAKDATAAAMVSNDKVVILKANPAAEPKPMGLGI